MKYVKFTTSPGINILLNVVFAIIGIYLIAYGIGYMAGAISGLLN